MSNDPLRHADVGEVKTVRETVELPTINFSPYVFYKRDRMGEPSVVDVGEDDDGFEVVRVTFEGDMVKCMGPYWATSRSPRTATERRTAKRRQWIRRGLEAAAIVTPIGGALAASWFVMQEIGTFTIRETTVEPFGWVGFAPVVVLVLFISTLVFLASRYFDGNGGRAVR